MSYANSENHKRNVRVLAEGAQGKKMTRKVDLWEYESLADLHKYMPGVKYGDDCQ